MEHKYDCPECGSDNTQRLSLVWQAGQSTSSSLGVGGGLLDSGSSGVGLVGMAGTSQTVLARSAAPPKQLDKQINLNAFGWVGAVVVFGAFIWALATEERSGFPIGFLLKWALIFGVVVAVAESIGTLVSPRARKATEAAAAKAAEVEAKNAQNRHDWEHTFACLRCGHRYLVE